MSSEVKKEEMKIALVLDDYKVPNKDDWWKKSLKSAPQIERDYDFVREESGQGITKDTTIFYCFYKLKDSK